MTEGASYGHQSRREAKGEECINNIQSLLPFTFSHVHLSHTVNTYILAIRSKTVLLFEDEDSKTALD